MRPLTLVALATLLLPASTVAQEPKSATYLAQVAAAVAGYSNGAPVWIVICEINRGEWDVVGGFATRAAAQSAVDANRPKRCEIEGPYVSEPVYSATNMLAVMYGDGCKKGPDSDCAGPPMDTSRAVIVQLENIQSVFLTFRLKNGTSIISQPFDPTRVNSIFLTYKAVERILYPYWAYLHGPEVATRKLDDMKRVFQVPRRDR